MAEQRVTEHVRGLAELHKKLGGLSDAMAGEALENAVESAALRVENRAKENVSDGGQSGLHVRSGNLRRSIGHELVESGQRVTFAIGTDIVYGPIHELGGVIRPIHGQYLAFEVDGQFVLAHEVSIPARPYLRPAFDEEGPHVGDEIKRVLELQIARFT